MAKRPIPVHNPTNKNGPDARERFLKHLDRDGQRSQVLGVLKECHVPCGIPTIYESSEASYKLINSYSVGCQGNAIDKFRGDANHTVKLFHGTKEFCTAQIILQGFKLPKHHGMFGKAVYLTPNLGKTFGYTGWNNRPVVFVCEAILGKIETMPDGCRDMDLHKSKNRGFDTALGKSGHTQTYSGSTLYFSEYAVYDPERIRILYLLEFERKVKAPVIRK